MMTREILRISQTNTSTGGVETTSPLGLLKSFKFVRRFVRKVMELRRKEHSH